MCLHRGAEVEELCRGSLEAVSSLYPALRNLHTIRELESVKQLFSRLYQKFYSLIYSVDLMESEFINIIPKKNPDIFAFECLISGPS